MLTLRPYKPCDADRIISWIGDETEFYKWSADRFGAYPITAADINNKYLNFNGDCDEPDNFFPFTAEDESGAVGHLIMRYTGGDKSVLRFGFVIVDSNKRGKGIGKEMLFLALKFAFEIYKAEKVTLGVFENNPEAYRCYRAVGFKDSATDAPVYYPCMGEQWKCLEMEITKEEYRIKAQ